MEISLKKELKAKAHHLNPVVLIGDKGLTENVIQEIDIALEAHELIKVKAFRAPKSDKVELSEIIESKCNSQLVQIIGNIMIFYRKKVKQKKK